MASIVVEVTTKYIGDSAFTIDQECAQLAQKLAPVGVRLKIGNRYFDYDTYTSVGSNVMMIQDAQMVQN